MRHQVTTEQIHSYRENGYLVIEDFVEGDELKLWQDVTQEAVDLRLEFERSRNVDSNATVGHSLYNQADPDNYYAQVFTQCVKLADTHAGMRELILDPRLGQLAGELAGVNGIRVWHDQALFKPPYGNPTGWHLDNPYWSFTSRDSISIWIAIDDATLCNGCMWYVPGSHKTATHQNAGIGQNMGDLFKVYPEWRMIDPVAAPAKAGTAVLHNGLTAHGAGANMTNKPRRAMTCAYMPDGSTYNGQANVLPDAYRAKLNIGDVIDDPKIVPLIWQR